MTKKIITILIVDDSALIRRMLSDMLSAVEDFKVVGTATDPFDAREKIKALNPNVVTLDIEMPKMDGLSFLEKIMALRPTPVIMVSTLTQKGAAASVRALEIGAIDCVGKPQSPTPDSLGAMRDELIAKIRAAAMANLTARRAPVSNQAIPFTPIENGPRLIAIGSSTGGVEALREIFSALPGNLPPIIMVQHMPAQFTGSLASRLDGISAVTVSEASHGIRPKPGHAYLAPGGKAHMTVARQGADLILRLEEGEPISGHSPSVDRLMASAAKAVGKSSVAALLTGMGRDGAEGMKTLKNAGAYTIGQSKASCVVYGMPRAAAELGALSEETSLPQIAASLVARCSQPVT